MADYLTPPTIRKKKPDFWGGFATALAAEVKRRAALKDAMEQFKTQQDMALAKQKDLAGFEQGLKSDYAILGQPQSQVTPSALDAIAQPEDVADIGIPEGGYGPPTKQAYDAGLQSHLGDIISRVRARTAQDNQKAALQALRNQGGLQRQEMAGQQKASQQDRTDRVAQWRIKSAEGIAAAGRALREQIANMDDATKRELATNEAGLKLQLKNLGVDASEQFAAGQAYKDAVVNGYMSHADAIKVAMETVAARRSVRPEESTPTPSPQPLRVTRPPFAAAQGDSVQTLQDQAQELGALIQTGPPGSPAVLQAQKKLAEIITELERKGVK